MKKAESVRTMNWNKVISGAKAELVQRLNLLLNGGYYGMF